LTCKRSISPVLAIVAKMNILAIWSITPILAIAAKINILAYKRSISPVLAIVSKIIFWPVKGQ
jgi:hypothetical protein